ncbi:hypothetical protein NPIL_215241 [Nephila pilipes]|uniref:Uncharacterized protein n=1 Tax=Nephila pilipes TaxID=299642 RepID=A0A8X6TRZ2_NEPPI|nr:hypothetical protein NPIL_215241 [Nephila pilipes]
MTHHYLQCKDSIEGVARSPNMKSRSGDSTERKVPFLLLLSTLLAEGYNKNTKRRCIWDTCNKSYAKNIHLRPRSLQHFSKIFYWDHVYYENKPTNVTSRGLDDEVANELSQVKGLSSSASEDSLCRGQLYGSGHPLSSSVGRSLPRLVGSPLIEEHGLPGFGFGSQCSGGGRVEMSCFPPSDELSCFPLLIFSRFSKLNSHPLLTAELSCFSKKTV